MSIKNKIAIVTESGSGIGKQIAIDFAKEGCNIFMALLISDQVDQSI